MNEGIKFRFLSLAADASKAHKSSLKLTIVFQLLRGCIQKRYMNHRQATASNTFHHMGINIIQLWIDLHTSNFRFYGELAFH